MDLQQAEQALRAAHQAGDTEAASKIAQGIRQMQAAPAEQSTGDIFREQLRAPLERAHPTRFPEHVEQAFREVVTEDIPRSLANAANASGTHYRTMLHGFGAPVAPPTEPEAEAYRNAVIDMLLTTGGGKLGQVIGSHVGDAARYLGRGFRTIPGAERFLTREAAAPAMSAAPGIRELINPTLSGAAVASVVDAMDPTPYELTDKPVAGGAGLGTAIVVGRNTIDDLLVGNPKWRGIMMSPSKGTAGKIMGAVLGHMAAQGINATAETVSEAVDQVERRLKGDEAVRTHRPYSPGTPLPLPAMGETRRY